MEPSTPVPVEIERIGSDGAGVGRLPDGRIVFVHRTAPGDRASVAVHESAPRWARGRMVTLEVESPLRRTPPCPFFDRCGGCVLQHLPHEAQMESKRSIAVEALRRIGKREDLPEPVLHPSPLEFRYRNRMTFTLLRRGVDGGRVIAGLHEIDRPDRLVEVDERCLLPEGPIAQVWGELRREWGPGAVRLPGGAELRLTLRATREGRVLLAVDGGKGSGEPEELLARIPGLQAVWQTFGRTGRAPRLLAGEGSLPEQWEGEEFELRPTAFLQVNRAAVEPMRAAVLAAIFAKGEGRTVLDAYCGTGSYGREVARRGGRCIGIELDPGAARAAREGAPEAFRVVEGRVEDHLAGALPAEVAVLNPPRAGVAPGVMEALARAGVERIVYASCDPATLARDLQRLGEGYRISGFEIFDLFPQTAHLETLLVLDRMET